MLRINRFAAIFTATLATVLMSATVSAAQTATDEDAPAEVDGLSMGEVVSNEPQPGDTYVDETIGDWSMRCIVVVEGEDPCQMYQLLSNADGDPVAEFTLVRLPEGRPAAAGATIVVPLETNLQGQLSIKVDDGQAKRYPFSFCNSIGCYARIGLTAEEVESYKAGAEADLWIYPVAAPDTQVLVKLSLTGFTAAFDKASILNQ